MKEQKGTEGEEEKKAMEVGVGGKEGGTGCKGGEKGKEVGKEQVEKGGEGKK